MRAQEMAFAARLGMRAAAIGTTAPILLRDTRHPVHDRRRVNVRWLAATLTLSLVSALLLWSVLHAAVRNGPKPIQPSFAATLPGVQAIDDGGRGDRLPLRRPSSPTASSPIHTSRMQSTGFGARVMTVLTAALDQLDALPSLPARPGPETPRPGDALPAAILGGGPVVAAVSPAGAALGYAAAEPVPNDRAPTVEPGVRGVALNVTTVGRSSAPPPDRTEHVVAQKGDTTGQALARFGFTPADIADLTTALGGGPKTTFAGGERLDLRWEGEAAPLARPYTVLLQRGGEDTVAAALTDSNHYVRVDAPAPPPVATALGGAAPDDPEGVNQDGDPEGSLREALGQLTGRAGTEAALTASILRVLGAGTDLGAGVAADDRLAVLYGTAAAGDEDSDPELDYAALTRRGRAVRFYRFATPDDGSVDYYDAAGHAVMKMLLRKPVAAGTLGDGFGWRIHPVLHDRRFHEGVDYRAPYGSPIVAAGAGTVEKIGYETGYGKYIRVRHDLGYETTYAHVSGFTRAMSIGRRVQQGETIAYVGSTGYSTGNHLYYEVKINGHNVDPLTVRLAGGRMLSGTAMAAFEARRDRIDTLMKASVTEAAR